MDRPGEDEVSRRRSERYKAPVALYNDPRRYFIDWIGDGQRVLDVGCACGDFAVQLGRERKVEVVGLEYDAGSVALARATEAFEEVLQTDLDAPDVDRAWDSLGRFDAIVLGDVLEHLRDPERVLGRLVRVLDPEGRVLVSLPNIAHASVKIDLLDDRFEYTERGIMDRTHLRFFTWRSISDLLDSMGLRIEEARTTVSPKRRITESRRFRELPEPVGRAIAEDPHSFVNQYVVRCRLRRDGDGPSRNREILRNIGSDGVAALRVHPLVRWSSALIPRREWRRRYRERIHLWVHRREAGRPSPGE